VATKRSDRPGAVVVGLSAAVLAIAIWTAAALATSLIGVPTSYGSGVDSKLGAQVVRDFLADQDAEAAALSSADQGPLGGHLTGSALVDVIQEVDAQARAGPPPKVTFQPSRLTVQRASDPADPSLTIQVQEEGTKTEVSPGGPSTAPTERTFTFHADFWLRADSGGHYSIADQNIQIEPGSPLPTLVLVATAVLAVVLVGILAWRQRALRLLLAPAPEGQPVATQMSPTSEPALQLSDREADVIIRTFGGLQVHQAGKNWAQSVISRPVTGFVWLRLLVAAIRDPSAPPARDELASQVTPGLSREVQLKRLRNMIAKGLPELPPVLRERIAVEPEVMGFRLEGCDVDAVELMTISAAAGHRDTLPPALLVRARRAFDVSAGVFLPEFEKIEDLATDRHPTCTQLIGQVRDLLGAKRIQLALVLADTYLSAQRPLEAIAVLEPAHREREDRQDLAQRLASAYRKVGRETEARAVDQRYA